MAVYGMDAPAEKLRVPEVCKVADVIGKFTLKVNVSELNVYVLPIEEKDAGSATVTVAGALITRDPEDHVIFPLVIELTVPTAVKFGFP
jgi:hypothetical protein